MPASDDRQRKRGKIQPRELVESIVDEFYDPKEKKKRLQMARVLYAAIELFYKSNLSVDLAVLTNCAYNLFKYNDAEKTLYTLEREVEELPQKKRERR